MNTPASDRFSIRRLERLADIVFAVALLLPLVTLDFAPEQSASAAEAYAFLWKSISQTLGFAISFLVIAYYWISHQEYFSYYTSTNKTHTFIELFYLEQRADEQDDVPGCRLAAELRERLDDRCTVPSVCHSFSRVSKTAL